MLLYQKTYETAQRSMNEGGKSFSFSEKMFRSIIGKNPSEVSITELEELNLDDYVCVLFYRCQNRLPDPGILKKLRELKKVYDDETIKFIVLITVCYSEEFFSKDAKIAEYQDMKVYKKRIGWRLYYGILWRARIKFCIRHYFLYPVCRILPESWKKWINKVRNSKK